MGNKMKLEVGKFYRTQGGLKVGPMGWSIGRSAFYSGNMFYLSCGIAWDDCRMNDLIAEWTNNPTVGTLAEIGAQVGDVVVLMEPDTFRGEGELYEIKSGPSGLRYAQHKDGGTVNWASEWAFRLISNAQPKGPVITETVTTKRIVQGRFGEVHIGGQCKADNRVRITLDGWLSEGDLTAAIETLTAVRDAMSQSSNT